MTTNPQHSSVDDELRKKIAKLAGLISIEHTEVVAFHPDDIVGFIKKWELEKRIKELEDMDAYYSFNEYQSKQLRERIKALKSQLRKENA